MSTLRAQQVLALVSCAWGAPGCINLEAGLKRVGGTEDSGTSDDLVLPAFEDDCTDATNDVLEAASGVATDEDGRVYSDLSLCEHDEDVYRVDVAANTWVQLSIIIHGTGNNGEDGTDLDMWEIEDPDSPIDDAMDFVVSDLEPPNIIAYSDSHQAQEQLAWANTGAEPQSHFVVVNGFNGATAQYDIVVRTSPWHDTTSCEEMFAAESDACGRIMSFPIKQDASAGYLLTHWTHYSYLRRDIAYLVSQAAKDLHTAEPESAPIALLDMSEEGGVAPGTMEGVSRHPSGTHVSGLDIDIAYFQVGDDNLARAVCPENDGTQCTGPAHLLEATQTTLFLAHMLRSNRLELVAVDPVVAEAIAAASATLIEAGQLDSSDAARIEGAIVSGADWPNTHDHMHTSWTR
jgi:hypothetical protein